MSYGRVMEEKLVSEAITPTPGLFDPRTMAAGQPGVPLEFAWRDRSVRVARLVRTWKSTGPCRHGSGERYVRRHWYEVETERGERMKLYFERQPRPGGKAKRRWWLYSVSPVDPPRERSLL